ncbi:GPN-loop GTPase [Plasmodium brasilianum]|uniref:GPN-loop GTPase 1 n=2 Tax=Plasmodium (Plasmodium) TaxID=418103 RepID=A0A1D3TC87_PLAMA|nr:XPA binding protein 1, putative [Plasmodium malariae]KAI4835549.1 GPN-loop GTPase [Plasmodium brasilianum]SCP02471.1 XPA binding protein 1, putative [Plasmodium malariae]
MEKRNDIIQESSEKKTAIKIDNYKINKNGKCADILKDRKSDNIPSKDILIEENLKHFEINEEKEDNCGDNIQKRECINISTAYTYNEVSSNENIGTYDEKKDNNLNENERKMKNFEGREMEVDLLNGKKSEIDKLNQNEVNEEKENEVNKLKEIEMNQMKQDEINQMKQDEMNQMKQDEVNQMKQNKNGTEDLNKNENLKDYYKNMPTVIIVIGMAGSGKTTYVGSLYNYLKVERKKKVYTMNLDPAVKYVQYPINIDIRDSIKYHEVMKEYKLGPNGAIMTCLNLFATRFDKVIEILEKRKHKLHYIIVDTPGQIEVFNWSASGNIILETLSVSFPVVINYIIDTVRCERPITFMSNMLYACSVLYKSRLPFLACFNKIDIIKHDKCIEWMKNYDSFNEDVLNDESYMASFSRSCALMINEFYEGIKTTGISSKTNEGFNSILKNLEYLKEEYINEYVSSIEKQMKKVKKKKEKNVKLKMESLLFEKQKDLTVSKNKSTY